MRTRIEGRTGETKTAARQEGVPIIPHLQKITDKYWKIWDVLPKGRSSADG
jgi:hypothetical protein